MHFRQAMRRELNDIEYFNWCVGQPYNMVVLVRIRGEVTPERLRAALGKAQARHPLLGVNTELGPNGIPSFVSDGVGPIPLSVFENAPPGAAEALLETELSSTFARDDTATERLPLLRVALFVPRVTSPRVELVFTVQHVIADGLSMVFLVRDLLRFMEAPEAPVTVLDAPASDADLMPAAVRAQIPKTARRFRFLLALVQAYARLGRARSPASSKPAAGRQHHRAWQLDVDETRRLRVRCHREGVSVQAAIAAALLPGFPAIHTPVNLRPFLARPVGESVGLYVGAAEVRAKYDANADLWSNARRFHTKLRRRLAHPFGIFRLFSKAVPAELVQRLGPLLIRVAGGSRPMAVTNLGALDVPGLAGSRFALESFAGAVTAIVDSNVLTVCTLGGSMRLALLTTESSATDTSIGDEVERAVARLRAAVVG